MDQTKKTIFISYGRDKENPQDVEVVRMVKTDLEKEGFAVLMDEEQLRTGQDWEIRLEDMIRQADWIVFFITPYSARRPDGYCLNELAMALAFKKSIAPIMVKTEVPPLSICRIQYLDLRKSSKKDEYRKRLKELIAVIKGENTLGFEGEHLKVLSALEPMKFETTIQKHIHGFTGRKWVYDEVDRWLKHETRSRILWIVAEPGFGKSALATYLARTHPNALSIHFCQYDWVESKDPKEMLKVLIYELSTQIEDYNRILQTRDLNAELKKSAVHVFEQLLLEPLYQIRPPDKKYFFLIDALDEAEQDGKNHIAELIASRFLELPPWLNIVITSRPEPELIRRLKKISPIELKPDDEGNHADLRLFLEVRHGVTDSEIMDALIRKSEGNILYLKFIFDLDMIRHGTLILEAIEELPVGMEEFYLVCFDRKFSDIDEYEEKYLPFLSLLVAEKGLHEILVRDALNLSDREYKQKKDAFGSLLETDGDVLTFYHKTVFEWLSDHDRSGAYSADLQKGRQLFQDFMDALTAGSYKKEYLEIGSFNRRLIDTVFEQDHGLDRFFRLLDRIDPRDKVETLDRLRWHYHTHNKMYRAVDIAETIYRVLKPLYQVNPEQWARTYTKALLNLASSYKKVNRVQDAIGMEQESLDILKGLYQQNSEKWTEAYARALNNLASSYKSVNRVQDAIGLEEESLSILKGLYQQKPEQWAEAYTTALNNLASSYKSVNRVQDAIGMEQESLDILKGLYQQHPEQWAEAYTTALNNLAYSYFYINRVQDAIGLQEDGLSILKGLYQVNPEQWVEHYTRALNNLAESYSKFNRIQDAIGLQEESLDIREGLYKVNPERWVDAYTTALLNLALSYKSINLVQDAIRLEKESLGILKGLYQVNPERWVDAYTTVLNNLAYSYISINLVQDAIGLEEENLGILKGLYQVNPERWAEAYTLALNNLAGSYSKFNRVQDAIDLEEESLGILKGLYKVNPEQWAAHYTMVLLNLAYSYYKNNRVQDAIGLQEESLDIREGLYKVNPERWVDAYTTALLNLALSYKSINLVQDAIRLEKESLGILKGLYQVNPERWVDAYTTVLNNLALSYRKIGRISETEELEEEIKRVKELHDQE